MTVLEPVSNVSLPPPKIENYTPQNDSIDKSSSKNSLTKLFCKNDLKGASDETSIPEREKWGSKWEFIFSCVGSSVGLGNVWRFPYLAYENGGGAFLLPYFILLLIVGKPMYLMECAMGQFSQSSAVKVWKCSPVGVGVGYAMLTISLIVAIYYNVIIGYCFFYMFASFTSKLPWESCNPDWADMNSCYVRSENTTCNATKCQSSSEQYWERYVLSVHKAKLSYQMVESANGTIVNQTYAFAGFGEIGEIKWDLTLCVLLGWILTFTCLCKGIKTSGKVVYFTATFPYLILSILFVRGLLLEGAADGVWYFFVPEWKKLLDIGVWRKAAEQMFFSLGVSWGGLIMFGSYNEFRNPVHRHTLAISFLDFATSIIAGVVVFSILGELKRQLGIADIRDVVKSGQGLAFIAYPEAVSLLAVSPLWAFLFFFMLLLLGVDSEFALLETALSGVYDMWPRTRNYKPHVTLALSIVLFLLSIPCCTSSGIYVFDIMDTYGGGVAVLWVSIFETIVVMWIYGVGNFADDLEFMLNTKISWYWKVCWAITPLILIAIFVINIYFWVPPTYAGSLYYPDWAHGIGWFLMVLVAAQIPIAAFVALFRSYWLKGKIMAAFRPSKSWGPGEIHLKEEWLEHKVAKSLQTTKNPFSRRRKLHIPQMAFDNVAMNHEGEHYNNNGTVSHM